MLTFQEAVEGENKEKWLEAIKDEKESLEENKTWVFVDETAASTKKLLSSRWVFKIKDDNRYKARLVVKGFEQEFGEDYNETFSPVLNSNSLRMIFALATSRNYEIMGFDVKTAFLYGELQEEIYMKVPEGFSAPGKVCKLQRSLYGLKQAPLCWNIRFTQTLQKLGLSMLKSEKCVFKNKIGDIILGIYVDDGILIGKDKVMENLASFLGLEIERTNEFLKLKQNSYVLKTLETFNMVEANPVETPIIMVNEEKTELKRRLIVKIKSGFHIDKQWGIYFIWLTKLDQISHLL